MSKIMYRRKKVWDDLATSLGIDPKEVRPTCLKCGAKMGWGGYMRISKDLSEILGCGKCLPKDSE